MSNHKNRFTNLLVFENPENGQIRLVDRKSQCVVKFFDEQQSEIYSVKFWKGDFEKTISFWNTKAVDRAATELEQSRFVKAVTSTLVSISEMSLPSSTEDKINNLLNFGGGFESD